MPYLAEYVNFWMMHNSRALQTESQDLLLPNLVVELMTMAVVVLTMVPLQFNLFLQEVIVM
jgi:hypothetical protein